MYFRLIPAAVALVAAVPAVSHDGPEPHPAWVDDVPRFNAPIAGIRNDWWTDYQTDVAEAESELRSDLRRATDAEDQNDAWEEYVEEISDAAEDYAGEMADRGHRSGVVTLGGAR